MDEKKLMLNVSSAPHVRDSLTTSRVMFDVVLALIPATFFGIYHFGLHAALVIAMSILTAVGTEFVFDYITHKPNTVKDNSAVVTGLLLALILPAGVPLYIPFLGSLFAILFVKCCFGGLGKNFMNPALAARCFLLISFGTTMTKYTRGVDAVTSATPLADLANGTAVNLVDMFLGFTPGIIGVSFAAVLLGAIYLFWRGHITWEIPVSYIVSFLLMMAIFGGEGFSVPFLLAHLFGGGIALGAFFMATDMVTSPMTSQGQLIYGIFLGVLTAIFRFKGSAADSVSYVIIVGNLLVPMIERLPVAQPFGLGTGELTEKKGFSIPKPALILMAITLVTGAALGGVNALTHDAIAAQEAAKAAQAYKEVVPAAEEFGFDDAITGAVEALGGEAYMGKDYINEVAVGKDASGNVVGYGISVTSKEAFDGTLTVTVGISADGTVEGISFTEITETAGMGMRCAEDEWKAQFAGKNVDSFVLNKAGGSASDEEIDSVSGASVTSGAVVNAVNAALDFFKNTIG